MSFLAPLFLLGGLLVALPVILHLTRKRREPVAFPSFLLLRMTSATARFKRRRFRNIPLLILRCLALLLLAAAFAEPVIRSEVFAATEGAPLDRAVLVDRSLSMTVGDRMEDARRAAQEEVDGLRREDRAVVLAFDSRAAALTELTDDPMPLRQAVAGLSAGDGGTGFVSALGLAGRLLPDTTGRRREVVLVSDLQRSGFEEGRPQPSLPSGVSLRVRQVGRTAPANAWVSGVTVTPAGRDQLAVVAEIRFGPSPATAEWTGPVELRLSDREVDRQDVTVGGDRSATARFDPVLRPTEAIAAEVRLSGDALPGDDRFHFVLHPEAAIRVVDVAGGAPSVYVAEALGVGISPAFELDRAPVRGEAAVREALAGARVALVRDPGRLDPGAVRALGDFVNAGGGMVMAMGPRRVSRPLATELASLLPALPGGFVDREPAGRLGDFATRHPIFEPFGEAGPAALNALAFFRYRDLGAPAPEAAVLARFDDGKPAIVESRPGAGRVLLFASSVDAEWTDLPRRPAFVPFLHRLVEVAAGYERVPVAYRVGESVDPETAFRLLPEEGDAAAEVLAEAPSGERTILTGNSALRLEEAGRYRARRPGGTEFRQIAANPPLPESDLRALDSQEVRIGAAAPAEPADAAASGAEATPDAPRVAAWWLLLAGLGLLLLGEAWFANRAVTPSPAG